MSQRPPKLGPVRVYRCPVCLIYFKGIAAWNRHRIGGYLDRRCLAISELAERGWRQDADGHWRRPP